MSHVWVDVEIADIEKRKSVTAKALVDTGASLMVVPKKLADELGLEASSEEKVITGAGIVTLKRAQLWIRLQGKEEPFSAWISEQIDKVLIGVVVLKSLGFEVDPTTETLREKPLLLYAYCSA